MSNTPPMNRANRRNLLQRLAGVFVASCVIAGTAQAQSSYTWNGGSGSTGNWSDGANWGGSGPANPQAFLNFNGSTRTSSTNDFSAGSAGYQIYFKSGASAFTLYGNSITFYDFGGGNPNIQNEGTSPTQTINFPILVGNTANGGILNIDVNTGTSQGPLTFNGTISAADANVATRPINVSGTSTTVFNGIISDFSSSGRIALTQLGTGTLTLTASNTFTGDLSVNNGTVVLATNNALANSGNFIRLGDVTGSAGANLNLNGGNTLATSINVRSGSSGGKIIANTSGSTGTATFGGSLFLDDNLVSFANTGGSITLSGTTLDLKNQTLTLDGTGSNIISGTLQNSTGSGKLVKNNTGNLYLNAAASYTGGTTISNGNIQVNANNVFGTGTVNMNDTAGNAKILLNGVTITNALTLTVANPGTGAGVIQEVEGTSSTWSGPITINVNAASGGHIVGPSSSGLLTISGPITVNSPATSLNIRAGFVRLSGGGSYTNMSINVGTNSLGANNGISTTAVLDIATSGAVGTALWDMNGFNQTLAGLRNSSVGGVTAVVTNSSATQSILTLNVSNVVTFGGGIRGNLAVNVTGGTQVISNSTGTANGTFDYTGDTTVSGGTLRTASANVLVNNSPTRGNMIVTNSGVLDLNAVSEGVNTLSGNGTIDNTAAGSPTLTIGISNNATTTFSGVIKNTAGSLSIGKFGTSTFIFTGTNNANGQVFIDSAAASVGNDGIFRLAYPGAFNGPTNIAVRDQNSAYSTFQLDGTLGNLTVTNTLQLSGRNNNVAPAIQSIAGNNTISAGYVLATGGSFYEIQNDTGTLTNSGTIPLVEPGGTRTFTFMGAGNHWISGTIQNGTGGGTVSLVKDGSGTATLTAANTFTGTTRVTNGTLIINNALALQQSTVDMNTTDSGTLNLNNLSATLGGLQGGRALALGTGTISVGNNGNATTYSGSLNGNALTKIGSGALTLSGNNAHTGATTVSAGELVGQTGGSISNNTVSVSAGATNGVLLASANGQWVCGNLTYSASTSCGDFNFGGLIPSTTTAPILVTGNLTFTATPNFLVRGSAISIGQYPLIKYGGTLSGTPPTLATFVLPVGLGATVSNNVANNSIDLVVTNGNAVYWNVASGNWDINTTANWKDVGGTSEKYLDSDYVVLDDTTAGASPITVTLSSSVTPAAITINLTNKTYTIASNAFSIMGSAPLVKNGSGTLTVAATNNLYTGSVTVNGGTLSLANAATVGTGTLTLGNGTTFTMGSGGTTFPANPIFVPAGASVSISGNGALGDALGGTITSGDSTSVINVISTFSCNATTRQFDPFLGTVTINGSQTLRFSNTSGGNGSTNATFNVLGTLQTRNGGQTLVLGAVSGSGNIGPNQTASVGNTTYIVGTNNASTTFSGKFVDFGPTSTTNMAVVTKLGMGTFTVSGNSAQSGATTVGAGSLMGVTGGSFSNSAVTVNNGATNGVSVTTPGSSWVCTNLTYAASGTEYALFSFGVNTPSTTVAPLLVQNSLAISGTLNIIINGGSTTIPVGTYPLIKYTNTLSGTVPAVPFSMPQYVSGVITNDTVNKLIALIVTNVIIPPPLVWTTGTSNWDFTSIDWTNSLAASNSIWIDGNAAQFDDTASGTGPFTVTLNTAVNPLSVTFSNIANNYTLSGTGAITGTGTLTKKGAGTLTIANTNTYNGGTIVSTGTLQGSSGTLVGSINNSASVVFDQSFNGSNNAVISGTGTVTKQNSGLVALGGTSTYTGKTFLNAGTLAISAGANLGGAPGVATPDQITINGGTLQATNGGATITLPANAGITVGASGATVDVASGITLDYPAQAISGTGALTKSGAGTFEIDEGTASSTYNGLTLNAGAIAFNKSSGGLGAGSLTINGGLIRTTGASSRSPNNSSILVNGDFTLGSPTTAAISFANGGAWTLANGNRTFTIDTITATITGVIGDGGNGYQLIKAGTGTLTLNNADTFSGGVSMTAGNLNLGNNGAAGSGSTIAYSGGSVQVGSGVIVTNKFDNASGTTSDLMMDCPAGTGVWAGPVTSSGAGGFRPGTSGGILVFTGNGSLGSKNLIVPRGTVVFATNANFSTTGGTIAFGRSTLGTGTSITVQNSASLSLTGANGFNLGGAQASPGPITFTIQDSASVSSGTQIFDLHNSTSATATTAVNLNGGTLSVGSFVKSQTGGGQTTTLDFNGGTLKPGQSTASFLPALSGLTAIVSAGGANLNDNGFNITVAQPLSHDAALGVTADGGLSKSGTGIVTLSGLSTYTGPTVVNNGTLFLTGSLGTNAVTVNAVLTGTGTNNGATTVNFGGTLQAGLGGNDTSTLTISNNLALLGNAQFNLNRTATQTANTVAGLATVTYGGTLTVTNVGNPLTNGDTFVLFSAASYAGGFTNIVLPSLDPSLLWNTNNLAVNGSISVVLAISASSLSLTSSENPSGYLDPLTFTATVTPTNATGMVTFFNGATPFSTNSLVAGVATSGSISNLLRGTDTITAIYGGSSSYYPSTNSLSQVVTNHPPVAGNVGYFRGSVASFKVSVADLITNVMDVDGDTITLTSLGTSTNGVTPTISGGYVIYNNPNIVNDQFTYTVDDGNGGGATGTITLTAQAFLSGQNSSVSVSGSSATVNFAGIPGYSYSIQRSTNMVDWAGIWTTNAPSNGLFNFTDNFTDLGVVPSSAYYRLVYNP